MPQSAKLDGLKSCNATFSSSDPTENLAHEIRKAKSLILILIEELTSHVMSHLESYKLN